jgi:hypothetical protein
MAAADTEPARRTRLDRRAPGWRHAGSPAAIIAWGHRRGNRRRITAPAPVIDRSDDPPVPAEKDRDSARHNPGATLRAIDGMDYGPPDRVLPTLADAFADHCRRSSPPSRGS